MGNPSRTVWSTYCDVEKLRLSGNGAKSKMIPKTAERTDKEIEMAREKYGARECVISYDIGDGPLPGLWNFLSSTDSASGVGVVSDWISFTDSLVTVAEGSEITLIRHWRQKIAWMEKITKRIIQTTASAWIKHYKLHRSLFTAGEKTSLLCLSWSHLEQKQRKRRKGRRRYYWEWKP